MGFNKSFVGYLQQDTVLNAFNLKKKVSQIDNLNQLIIEDDFLTIISTNTAGNIIICWIIGLVASFSAAMTIPILILKPLAVLAILFLSYFLSKTYKKIVFDLEQKMVFVRRGSLKGKTEYESWIPKPFDKVNLYATDYLLDTKFEAIINMNGKTLIKCDDKKTATRLVDFILKKCPDIAE